MYLAELSAALAANADAARVRTIQRAYGIAGHDLRQEPVPPPGPAGPLWPWTEDGLGELGEGGGDLWDRIRRPVPPHPAGRGTNRTTVAT